MTTIHDIVHANTAAGYHFFDRETLRFFQSYTYPGVHEGPGGIYFVTRECGPFGKGPDRFTVRRFNPKNSTIGTAGEFQAWATLEDARLAAQAAASGKDGTVPHNG